ncbi:MAG: Cof-type HAD-IIB family hydrolase [Firmicutes bacterium]|nr:Cof-type HAD-IIB family hydrolase [Bacillota bacterium]
MPIRLIAIDIDGTLLNSRWELPEANREAIGAAVARGVEIVLVTGRRFDFALPIAHLLAVPVVLVVNNGALIKSPDGTTHLRRLLPRALARAVLEATPEFRAGAAVMFDRPRENQVIFEQIDWEDAQRRDYFERNRSFLAEIAPLESCLTEDPIQVLFTGPVERMRELARRLNRLPMRDQFSLALTEYASRNFALVDVVQRSTSKGSALQEWASRRKISRDEILAIGDNLNDREMLEWAGIRVLMGNCVPELRQLGWPVTLTNDEAGVAAAIEAFALHPDGHG